jgi:hypothetical protein
VQVRAHKKPECALDPGAVVLVELYVGNPSLVMQPSNPNSAKLISLSGAVAFNSSGIADTPISWTVPAPGAVPATAPDSPGHKCLLARIYPDNLSPDPANFHLPDDQHYAQHNLCIVTCSSPCGLDAQTVNPNRKVKETIMIRAVADLEPNARVMRAVLPALRAVEQFKRLSTQSPPPFRITVSGFPKAKVTDCTKQHSGAGTYGHLGYPNYCVTLDLKPKQVVRFRFSCDLSGVPFGDAFIFHLTHIGANHLVQGGLTVGLVRVKP